MKEMAAEAPDSPEVKAARLWKSAAETVKQQGKESKLKQKELILHLQQLSMQKAELRKQQEHQATSTPSSAASASRMRVSAPSSSAAMARRRAMVVASPAAPAAASAAATRRLS